MARLEQAIVQEIKDNAALLTLLTRVDGNPNIFVNAIPQAYLEKYIATDLNYLVYNRISTEYKQLFGYQIVTIQFSIFSKNYSELVDIRSELIDTFHRVKQTVMGSSGNTQEVKFAWMKDTKDFKDPDSELYMMTMDCAFKILE